MRSGRNWACVNAEPFRPRNHSIAVFLKWLLVIVAVLTLVAVCLYIVMAIQSQKKPQHLGLHNGMLYPCPDSPNCVCSETHTPASHAIEPIQGDQQTWEALSQRITALGGVIEHDDGDYLHATFVSSLFRFVDDVELRRDAQHHGLIHVRSASRVGRTDFSVNRQRVEQLFQGMETNTVGAKKGELLTR